MKLSEIIKESGVSGIGCDPDSIEISGISYDSRKTSPGDVFVAISGFETDGRKFIPMAVAKGAAAVVCETVPEADVPYVLVDNARYALAIMSRNFCSAPASKMKIIGITGTNGKTTSAILVKHMIEHCTGKKVGLIGTNGNMIGTIPLHSERTTPESLELQMLFSDMLDAGCEYVVMEVSSHSLSLDRVAGIRFDVAAFTNLTQDHLDFHQTMENYAAAKRILFSRSAVSCINMDDPYSGYMLSGVTGKAFSYGIDDSGSDLYAENVSYSAEGVEFTAVYGNESSHVKLRIPGMFSVHNALNVISIGINLGFKLYDCAASLADAKGVKGRVEHVPVNGDYSVLIDYAHTPDALENVLKTLKPLTRGRLICLFGCGGDRDRSKRPQMGKIAASYSDIAVVTSDNPRTEEPEAIISDILEGMHSDSESTCKIITIVNRIEAIHYVIDNARPGDVILLAGKGHEDYQEINHVKHHMDEREIVADHIKEIHRCS